MGTNETEYGYVEALATETMRAVPRFGKPAKFALLFGSEEQQTDYVTGLLFAGVFILFFFIVWLLLIVLFKFEGQKKVGFLSGHAFKLPSESKRPVRIRITFVIAAIILLVFSVLLVTKGLTQLEDGVRLVYDSVLEVNSIITQAEASIANLETVAKEAAPLRNVLVARLQDDFCPAANLSALTAKTGIDYAAVLQNVSTLSEFGNFTDEDIDELQHALNKTYSTTDDAEQYSEEVIEVSDWQSLIFIIPFSIFFIILVAGVAFASCQQSRNWLTCIITWIVLPLFLILITICWVLCGLIVIYASANADFCSGGDDGTPGSSIKEIMEVMGYEEEDFVYLIIAFYVGQCARANPFVDFGDYENNIAAGRATLLNFDAAVKNTTIDGLMEICGEIDFQSIEVIARALAQRVTLLVDGVERLLDVLSCENLVPLYTNAFWDGTCQYSVTGATWTFSSFLVIGIMGMLMFTFRAACRPNESTNLHNKLSDDSTEHGD